MQWLVNALATDDVKKGGDRPPYLKHISSSKNATSRYRIAIGFLPEIFSRHWLASKRKKILERSSPLSRQDVKANSPGTCSWWST